MLKAQESSLKGPKQSLLQWNRIYSINHAVAHACHHYASRMETMHNDVLQIRGRRLQEIRLAAHELMGHAEGFTCLSHQKVECPFALCLVLNCSKISQSPCLQPGCDSLEDVGVAIALKVAKETAKTVDKIVPPRQYHAVWIRIEAIARSLV